MKLYVLIACEESQAVCKAFRDLGHEAYSYDLQECSGGHPEWHIQGDITKSQILKHKNHFFVTQDGLLHNVRAWDILIAHPPCTYMSNAGACRMYKRINGKQYIDADRFAKMIEAREFFDMFYFAPVHYIAIENPLPLKICNLPTPTQIIQPYEFGHPYSKKTLLWLRNLPLLTPTEILKEHTPFLPSNTSNFAKGKKGSHGVVRVAKITQKRFPE